MLVQHPHDVSLPRFSASAAENTHSGSSHITSRDIAQAWLDRFSEVISRRDPSRFDTVFHNDSWWRDHLALSWDLRTIHGLANITSFVSKHISETQLASFTIGVRRRKVSTLCDESTRRPLLGAVHVLLQDRHWLWKRFPSPRRGQQWSSQGTHVLRSTG